MFAFEVTKIYFVFLVFLLVKCDIVFKSCQWCTAIRMKMAAFCRREHSCATQPPVRCYGIHPFSTVKGWHQTLPLNSYMCPVGNKEYDTYELRTLKGNKLDCRRSWISEVRRAWECNTPKYGTSSFRPQYRAIAFLRSCSSGIVLGDERPCIRRKGGMVFYYCSEKETDGCEPRLAYWLSLWDKWGSNKSVRRMAKQWERNKERYISW